MQVAAHLAFRQRHQGRHGNAGALENALVDRLVAQEPVAGDMQHMLAFGPDFCRGDQGLVFALQNFVRMLHYGTS
jgi:hypothetical protein